MHYVDILLYPERFNQHAGKPVKYSIDQRDRRPLQKSSDLAEGFINDGLSSNTFLMKMRHIRLIARALPEFWATAESTKSNSNHPLREPN